MPCSRSRACTAGQSTRPGFSCSTTDVFITPASGCTGQGSPSVIRSQSRFRQTNRLPRAEVDADPDAVILVGHQVHVVVARADGAELRLRELRELALRREVGAPDPVDHGMVDPLLRRHAHGERDPSGDLAHDTVDTAERVEVVAPQVGQRSLVSAADVVADSRRGDVAWPLGHGVGEASERIRTSAPGVEARCSRPLSYGGVTSRSARSSPTRTCSVSRRRKRAASVPTYACTSSRPAR